MRLLSGILSIFLALPAFAQTGQPGPTPDRTFKLGSSSSDHRSGVITCVLSTETVNAPEENIEGCLMSSTIFRHSHVREIVSDSLSSRTMSVERPERFAAIVPATRNKPG